MREKAFVFSRSQCVRHACSRRPATGRLRRSSPAEGSDIVWTATAQEEGRHATCTLRELRQPVLARQGARPSPGREALCHGIVVDLYLIRSPAWPPPSAPTGEGQQRGAKGSCAAKALALAFNDLHADGSADFLGPWNTGPQGPRDRPRAPGTQKWSQTSIF